jgi:predicted DNA-binding transcriptional regulator AlpA
MIKTKAGQLVVPGKNRHGAEVDLLQVSPFVVYNELPQFGIKFSRKHLLDLMRAGLFPAARQLSANRVAWLRSELLAYVESRPVSRASHAPEAVKPVSPPLKQRRDGTPLFSR